MSQQSALLSLARIEELTNSAAQVQDKSELWQRDKAFISAIRQCVVSDDVEQVHWAFEQMRNLSQGFGSYCTDLKQLDHLLDQLHTDLKQLLLERRV